MASPSRRRSTRLNCLSAQCSNGSTNRSAGRSTCSRRSLNCLSAQCSNGRSSADTRSSATTRCLNCLSAQCSNGSLKNHNCEFQPFYPSLNCLSAQCSNGSRRRRGRRRRRDRRVSIAFRLNARTVARPPCHLVTVRQRGVSIAFRLNARTVAMDCYAEGADVRDCLNCLSAQCSNGRSTTRGVRAPQSSGGLNCLSAQCSNGSYDFVSGAGRDERGRVSIAFRLNARTVDATYRGPPRLYRGVVSIAFRLNARTVDKTGKGRSWTTWSWVSIAFRLNARTVARRGAPFCTAPPRVSIAFRLNARTVGGWTLRAPNMALLKSLNCLSAQCSNGRPPSPSWPRSSPTSLNCLSAQCSNGRIDNQEKRGDKDERVSIAFRLNARTVVAANCMESLKKYEGLNCLSAQCSNGRDGPQPRRPHRRRGVSIAFRLNARTVVQM